MAGVRRVATATVLGAVTLVLLGLVLVPGTVLAYPLPAASPPLAPPTSHVAASLLPSMSSVHLQQDGSDPEVAGLNWTLSSDPCFYNYTLNYSAAGANGPWQTAMNLSNQSVHSTLVSEYVEDTPLWWQVVTASCVGRTASNAIEVAHPAEPTLSYRFPSETTLSLSWVNPSIYSDLLAFSSYQLMAYDRGQWSTVAGITDYSEQGATVPILIPSAGYTFQLLTTDTSPGTGAPLWYFLSEILNLTAPSPFTAGAAVHATSVDVGQAAILTCAAVGGVAPYAYSWSFGDGGAGLGPNVSHVYGSAGAFVPVCSVQDAISATVSAATGEVTVWPELLATASVERPAAYPGTVLTFTAGFSGGSGSVVGYSWDFGDGSSDIGPIVSHLFAAPSDYLVHLVVVDSNGGSAVATTQVAIQELSAIASASGSNGVPGVPIGFSSSAQGGGGPPYGYAWAFGDGTVALGPNVSHSYAAPGSYSPTVVVTDSMGGERSASAGTITVNPAPARAAGSGPGFGLGPTVAGVPILLLVAAAVLLVAAVLALTLRRPPRERRRLKDRSAAPGGRPRRTAQR